MAEFLSAAWIAELDAAARKASLPSSLRELTLTVEQVVRRGADDEVRYHLRFADGRLQVRPGAADAPDLRLLADYDTARAMQLGRLNAQGALATGRLKLQGRLEVLVGRDDALVELAGVFEQVRASTTFAEAPGARSDR